MIHTCAGSPEARAEMNAMIHANVTPAVRPFLQESPTRQKQDDRRRRLGDAEHNSQVLRIPGPGESSHDLFVAGKVAQGTEQHQRHDRRGRPVRNPSRHGVLSVNSEPACSALISPGDTRGLSFELSGDGFVQVFRRALQHVLRQVNFRDRLPVTGDDWTRSIGACPSAGHDLQSPHRAKPSAGPR